MTERSRQFAHLRRRSLDRLKVAAARLPLAVLDDGAKWIVMIDDGPGAMYPGIETGRFQVAMAWVEGFAVACRPPYQTIAKTGYVVQRSSELLAWLKRGTIPGPAVGDDTCRLCLQTEGHNPALPCGQLMSALTELSAHLRYQLKSR